MITFTDENFYDLLSAQQGPVLVDFWAEWCRPCQALTPIVNRLDDILTVGKVDVEANPILTKTFKITSVPTLILFDELKPVDKVTGSHSYDTLVERYSKWL